MQAYDRDELQKCSCNSEKMPLLEGLQKYSREKIACFDVPGHVKDQGVDILNEYFGANIMKMDINSSPRMDNVSNPQGIIKEAQELLAKAYKADQAFFITNGTTQAIHIMLMSILNPGDKILLPRNIHKSVINALVFSEGDPVFIQPEFDEELGISMNVDSKKVIDMLKQDSDIKAVFLLNPTYYGACTDLKEIIDFCNDKEILVLVDEAHGAHFPFHKDLPPSGIGLGADMAAVSIHKTGGALTQASALLVNEKKINVDKVRKSINMFQSTSASYLLMASIDGARANLVENGQKQLSQAISLARYAKLRLNKIDGVKATFKTDEEIVGAKSVDETKLCINVCDLNITGFEVYDLLYKDFDIQAELGDLYNILALISIGTTKENVNKLIKAIEVIAKKHKKDVKLNKIDLKQIMPTVKLNPRKAFYAQKESVDIKDSINRISGESIMAYPPGIPIVSPGEIITKEIVDYIEVLKSNNAHLTDMKDQTLKTIMVIK